MIAILTTSVILGVLSMFVGTKSLQLLCFCASVVLCLASLYACRLAHFVPQKVGPGRYAYRNYLITDDGYINRWSYVHNDYDGAPLESGGPPADHRCGEAKTLDAVKEEIDEMEDDQ